MDTRATIPAPGEVWGRLVHREEVKLVRAYEIMIILKPTLDEEKLEAFLERVTDLLTGYGSEIEKVDRWGKRRFSYELKDYREGYYIVLTLRSKPEANAELNRVLRLSEDVLRHMIVSRDD